LKHTRIGRCDQGAVGELLENFLNETRNELFETREECYEFYTQDENWERLENGEIGDNLMYKYRAQASFFYWDEICDVAMETMKSLIAKSWSDSGENFDTFWSDLCTYVKLKHAAGESKADLLAPVNASLHHDITQWLDQGATSDYAQFALDAQREAEFYLPEDARRELELALETWELSLRGMTKGVTRIRNSAQIRSYRWSGAEDAISA